MSGDRLKQQDLRVIYRSWAQGAGPFECFVRKPNFVSLQHYPDFELQPVPQTESRLYKDVRSLVKGAESGSLFLIETSAAEGIRLGYLLQQRMRVKPILTFGSPLHPYGIVGGERYISALLGYGRLLTPIDPVGYAFILDRQRYREKLSRRMLRQRFNNQYELSQDDLPSIEMLKHLGYQKLVAISRHEPKIDLLSYLQYLRDNHFKVEGGVMIDEQEEKGSAQDR
ncbi:MAG: hypothetical protein HPY50_19665 [Firmicutes bacterium]|nr:hypothetical protein [Bacillota bacterium]